MDWNGHVVLMARVEGWDRKSFFAVAESSNGVDGFRFWDYPVRMPELEDKETNLYDMRLVRHEDGWIYGLFCAERHDDSKPGDLSAAIARCGIARTKDLVQWERLPDLKTSSLHQRNCVLHPEFVNGKYAFYTRPMTDFAATGSGDGIGWGLCDDIANAAIGAEQIIDPRFYHTIKEGKNGLGPAPIKTEKGWLHLAHGVRNDSRRACDMSSICSCAIWTIRPKSSKLPADISWPRKAKSALVMCPTWCSPTAGWRAPTATCSFITVRRTPAPMSQPALWINCSITFRTPRQTACGPEFAWNDDAV